MPRVSIYIERPRVVNFINLGGGDPLCTLYRAEGLYIHCTVYRGGPLQFTYSMVQTEKSQKIGLFCKENIYFFLSVQKYSNKTFLKSRYFSTKLLRKTYFKIFQFKRAQSDSILWLTCSWSSRGWRLRGSSGWRLMRPGSWRLTRLHNWRMRCCQRCGDRTQVMQRVYCILYCMLLSIKKIKKQNFKFESYKITRFQYLLIKIDLVSDYIWSFQLTFFLLVKSIQQSAWRVQSNRNFLSLYST